MLAFATVVVDFGGEAEERGCAFGWVHIVTLMEAGLSGISRKSIFIAVIITTPGPG